MKNRLSKFLHPLDFSATIDRNMGTINFGDAVPDSLRKREKLFLREFTADRLFNILKSVKIVDHLSAKGFNDLKMEIDVDDSAINYLKLYNKKIDPDSLLLDLRVSESRFIPDSRFFDDDLLHTYDMIVIEWLSAQNPANNFDAGRPQMPGQRRPGLGILNYLFEIMYVVARQVTRDGFLDIPDHLHGAIMYSRKFKFFDPVHEGILRAIMRDLDGYSLTDISWGILTHTIIEEYKNLPQEYAPSEQIFYVSDRMREYYHSKKYLSVYNTYYKRKRYRFEYDTMVKKREEMLRSKSIADL